MLELTVRQPETSARTTPERRPTGQWPCVCCTGAMPRAYVVVDMDVTDPDRYTAYRELAGPAVEAAGGRYLARGGATEVFEGDRQPHRMVILEFPDMDAAQGLVRLPRVRRGTRRPRGSRCRVVRRRRGRLTRLRGGRRLRGSTDGDVPAPGDVDSPTRAVSKWLCGVRYRRSFLHVGRHFGPAVVNRQRSRSRHHGVGEPVRDHER